MVGKDTVEYLQSQWAMCCADDEHKASILANYFNLLIASYSEPHRAYHRPEHLQHMISLLRSAGVQDNAVYWASFYHDYVYSPGKSNNEEKSAEVAAQQMTSLGVHSQCIDRTKALICATKHYQWDINDKAGCAFLDADMAILGAPLEIYLGYKQAIREEFNNIPGFLFNKGRKSFLQQLMKRERIFLTQWFFEKFESQARHNIAFELAN